MPIVYILTNHAMPGLIKIGKTENDIIGRIKELSIGSGVPLPFECVFASNVEDAEFVEKKLHEAFKAHRINPKREFFRLDPLSAIAALEIAKGQDATPNKPVTENEDEEIALENAKVRAEKFNFEMVNIKAGETLHFRDDPNITCTVVGRSKINYGGEVTSLSAAAQSILKGKGSAWKSVQGPAYWLYKGKTLVDLRDELEIEE